ncbi:MAG: hypothetical protein NVV57_05200 [Demequina sp.]|jgi:hypothetical protein|nr:hypothetical protein [Demequina sp.]
MSSDPHVMAEGTLPTPFSADELRAGLPAGTVVVLELDGGIRQVNSFRDPDAEGATWTVASPGSDEHSERVTWRELQSHASFPMETAARRRETIEHPLGTLDCWRYDVGTPQDGNTFWFDLSRPGMPVRMRRNSNGIRIGGFEAVEWSLGPGSEAAPPDLP